ncbi:MAG: thioredoxin-like domain-containing protein [Bryobacteraceae bacterium]|nr:thioredoxin-like domain-containing protein [Bryobacteraceae bacterium]
MLSGLLLLAATATQLQVADLSGNPVAIQLSGKPTAVVFVSTLCPISNDYNERMSALYRDYKDRVRFVFVNANQNESSADVSKHAADVAFPFVPYKDPNNALADRLNATVTPEAFLFDAAGQLQYHGPIDDARNAARVTAHHLRESLDAVLAGRAPAASEKKAFGCTIKRVKKAS